MFKFILKISLNVVEYRITETDQFVIDSLTNRPPSILLIKLERTEIDVYGLKINHC